MSWDLPKINAYVDRARELEPINFKTLYFWLTEAFDWAGSPRGVPTEFLIEFGQMSPWEKANTVHKLGLHMHELMRADFQKLVGEARDWDYKQELAKEGHRQMIEKGWWEDEKGRLRSPLDDPDCPFLLESDDHPK
jgi:hypothetical protein